MNNISNIHDCYGCGVCATVCAKQIISIELNGDGFYEPRSRMNRNVPVADYVSMSMPTLMMTCRLKTDASRVMVHGARTRRCAGSAVAVAWALNSDARSLARDIRCAV